MKQTFLWRYRVVITSALLMIVSIHLMTTGVKPRDFAYKPTEQILGAISPVQEGLTRFAQGSNGIVRDYFTLVNVSRENRQLKDEVAKLKSQQTRLNELQIQNQHLSDLLELKDALDPLNVMGAEVIGADAGAISRTMIVSQGSESGIQPGMAVISTDGVVGRVIACGTRASRVLRIDDHNSALDAFDQRTRARGIVTGLVDDGVIMKYVERSQDLRVGDALVTSGLDPSFPRGLLVGTVKSVSQEGPGMFLNVQVAPAVDFRNLEQVLIITQQKPQLSEEPTPKG